MKSLHLAYFAWVKQEVGFGQENLQVSNDINSISDLVSHLKDQNEGYKRAFADSEKLRCAVNLEFCDFDTVLKDGDEVAFFPPVTGG
ncbi:MAG: molybdopterin converting factor subunit 1 [Alphaproteobacteria bacterium]